MHTKRERFAQWHCKQDEEQNYLNTALLVFDYLSSVTQLETISTEFSGTQSAQYKLFNQYKTRPMGVLLFCRLEVDEAIEQLVDVDNPERKLLSELKSVLAAVYEHPQTNASRNLNDLINKTMQLLDLDPELLTNRAQSRNLCFILYTLLHLISLIINNLNFLQRTLVGAVINLGELKIALPILLQKTEEKIKQIDALNPLELEPVVSVMKTKTVQDYFNDYFLTVTTASEKEGDHLISLEESMDEVTNDTNSFITARNKKEVLILKIKKIQELLNSCIKNDKKISARQYFLALINTHQDAYNLLIDNSNGFRKDQLLRKIKQLKNPDLSLNLSSKVLYGLSWAAFPLTLAYRSLTPQIIQDTVSAQIPTSDSQCKAQLKNLAQECLFMFEDQLTFTNTEIERLSQSLSHEQPELKQLLMNTPTEALAQVVQANDAVKGALKEYRRITDVLDLTVSYLHVIKESSNTLTQFIQTHDDFWVMLSNIFSNISSLFKSDTAKMIDSARKMNNKLARFEADYKKELTKELNAVEDNPHLNKVIKETLQQKLGIELRQKKNIIPYSSPTIEDVRHLKNSLKQLFNSNLAADPEEYDSDDTESLAAGLS